MDRNLITKLADYIHQAEKDKREIIKITHELYPDLTIEEAYLVQEEVVRQKLEEGKQIVGPKMGITSEAKMRQMNVDDPIYGYVFDDMLVDDGGVVHIDDYIHPKVEPEIGFVLKEDLVGPNVTLEDVLRVTEFVFPAVEIIDSRYKDFNFTLPDVIADNTSAAGAIFGSTVKRPDEMELDVVGVTLIINGEIRALGAGAAVLGHPANSVARLANMLSEKGEKVKAGQPILTGGITEAVALARGDYVVAKYGGLGEVSFLVR